MGHVRPAERKAGRAGKARASRVGEGDLVGVAVGVLVAAGTHVNTPQSLPGFQTCAKVEQTGPVPDPTAADRACWPAHAECWVCRQQAAGASMQSDDCRVQSAGWAGCW